MFTNIEYTDMLLVIGECHSNVAEAVRTYANRFPNRRQPSAHVLRRPIQRARDTGRLAPRIEIESGRPRGARVPDIEELVLNIIAADPSRSTRSIAQQITLSQTNVHRIIAEEGLHPYHLSETHALLHTDYPLRQRFCNWLLEQNRQNSQFLQHILWTDEANFSRDGFFNSCNSHVYATENPHATISFHLQDRFSVNVWAGILGIHLLGPVILPYRLNGPVDHAAAQKNHETRGNNVGFVRGESA
ncbi:hypothetical protein YQE_09564, partial [Dendroctonus ponderosae]